MNNIRTFEDYQIDEADYALWLERFTMADCFRALDMNEKAEKVMRAPANMTILAQFVAIIKRIAKKQKNNDVLELLASHHLLNIG
jgi:hypothetical protein